MIKIIAVVVAVLVAGILILAATKPDTFTVERATTIKAPPDKIFPLISDLKAWTTWSPYEKKDPAMQRTYSSATSGKGAVYAWESNRNVGSGRMEILRSSEPAAIVIKLDFFKPFEGHNIAEFTMLPQGDSTRLTWMMHGPAPLMSRVIATASGPVTGVAGAASADSSTRIPVDRTPVPAPSWRWSVFPPTSAVTVASRG